MLNPLLDQFRVRLEECELLNHLRLQLLVRLPPPRLHNPDNRCVDRERPIFLNPLLFVRLFRTVFARALRHGREFDLVEKFE